MSLADRLSALVTTYSKSIILVLLLLTVLVGAGAGGVEQSSSLDQFQSDTTEAEKLEYVEENFASRNENGTSVQVIVRGDDVLAKESLLETLELQRALRANETVNGTLAENDSFVGVSNVVAAAAIRQEQAADLAERGRTLQRDQAALNATVERLTQSLDETRDLQREYDALNRSYEQGEVDDSTYEQRSSELESRLASVREGATAGLTDEQAARYARLQGQTRDLQAQLDALNASYQAGEIDRSTYEQRVGEVRAGFEQVYQGVQGVVREDLRDLQQRGEQLQADRAALENVSGSMPSLDAQIEQLESMNGSEVEESVLLVLGEDAGGNGMGGLAFSLMPTSYEPGSTSADARMLVVRQSTERETVQGMASERLVSSQQAIQDISNREVSEGDVLAFGSGIISTEIDQSMGDSIVVVGPLALLFVLLTLVVAYRDLVDIALGLFGIGVVLALTFGFMGWAGYTFNQIFIAVPVLLIGLSIDYAIHIFMRHREEREAYDASTASGGEPRARDAGDQDSVRGSMTLALASVGVALVWVTATTVIGFLSNVVSPLPPIQDFGVVSSAGIVAALVVFGALIPALKVEIDGFLEARGWDRRKRAFGTGGGRFTRVLGIGSTLARRAPVALLVVTLLVSTAGAYGATQVDTSFDQEDFIAEEPPDWMQELPEPFAPGEYTAKANLEYVNRNFVREDSQAQLLVEGSVTSDGMLERVHAAEQQAADSGVVVVLSNGEPEVTSPLTAMEAAAAGNESFNETFHAADTDGNGVPDRNLERVYDAFYAAAPGEAERVLHRTDGGEYESMRMVVSVRGDASSATVTEELRDVAANVERSGLTVTATGQTIVFEIVQEQLLETVIESLLITLVAVFAFLMLAYRITDGSATLGAVTLLPVVFSVTWILGTMYLLDMPFNVLTGMITSLTVGLGVAYSIHLSERYVHELERHGSVWTAMDTTVAGTGGALLGSAATTVGGFGVLVFAILPPLQQFGIITGLTIIYAFVASVVVLPSLLVLWTRYLADVDVDSTSRAGATAVEDGGEPGGDR